MRLSHRFAALVFTFVAGAVAASAQVSQKPLQFDPKVTVGTLPNGLHYYIRKNAKPEKRAELRLVVNAGSIQEDADQLGYAHFVEHMAFNGTTHFKKNELVNYLQSIGLQFGADLNAGTSFDETIYNLTVPTDTARLVEGAFQVLADWAHGQLFDSTEVVNERGVVLEEWRRGKGAGERMSNRALPIILKGSMYADRLPIGTDQSIMSANPSGLKRFYDAWYRPDLMAVIAVGDFDVAQVEALIKKDFGDIPMPANPRPRTPAAVPANQAPLVSVQTDKEAQATSMLVGFKRPRAQLKTIDDYRRTLIERIYLTSMNGRLTEMAQKPKAPFNGAGMSLGGFFGREVDAFTISVSVKDGGLVDGLSAVLTEIRRADEFGILETEMDRAKTTILSQQDQAYNERETQPHGAYVGSYISAFLNGSTPMSIEYTRPLVKDLLTTIDLGAVNAAAATWIGDDNRVFMATAPDKVGVKMPSEKDLLGAFTKSQKDKLKPYVEASLDAPFLLKTPVAGKIVSERTIADIGVTEWKLSNGARVLVKPTDFKSDEVLFTGASYGGTSLASDEDAFVASLASNIAAIGGAGRYNGIELRRKLAGKVANALAGISDYGESVSGNAAPRDLETMLQLAYAHMIEPKIDMDAWLATKDRLQQGLVNRATSPDAAFADTINTTMSQNDPRERTPTPAMLEEVKPDRALAFYKDRFADVSDFTFAFVGNVKPETLKPMVEMYLASLPGKNRKETWKDVHKPPPTGVIEKTVRKGSEPKATTQFFFTGAVPYTPENRFAMNALLAVLRIRLTETLREQLGGTYSPSAGGSTSRIPREQYSISIGYQSAPDNVEKLSKSVFAIIDTLMTKGPSQSDVDKVREQLTRSRETAIKTNGYWLGQISSREEGDVDNILKNDAANVQRVKDLTPAQIQAAAKLYFNLQNYAKFVLLPEKMMQ